MCFKKKKIWEELFVLFGLLQALRMQTMEESIAKRSWSYCSWTLAAPLVPIFSGFALLLNLFFFLAGVYRYLRFQPKPIVLLLASALHLALCVQKGAEEGIREGAVWGCCKEAAKPRARDGATLSVPAPHELEFFGWHPDMAIDASKLSELLCLMQEAGLARRRSSPGRWVRSRSNEHLGFSTGCPSCKPLAL